MAKRKVSACQLDDIFEDGILYSIISSLTMREAARTTILSRRWRYIWRYMSRPNLIFDAFNMLASDNLKQFAMKLSSDKYEALFTERREKFIKSVDEVLEYHRGEGVDTFKVNFSLDMTYADHLDRWIAFAIKANAKEIVLILEEREIAPLSRAGVYGFPCHFFVGQGGCSLESLCLEHCILRVPPSVDGFNSLKSVDFAHIYISDRDIQNLLSNCLFIESLSLRGSMGLVNLKFAQPLWHLKFLNITYCYHLVCIDLSAPSLETFKYTGLGRDFVFGKASSLTKAYICIVESGNFMDYALAGLSRDLPHLQTLFLDIKDHMQVDSSIPVTKFNNLKHLVTNVSCTSAYDDLLHLVTLLNAAPYVEKLEVHLQVLLSHPDKLRKIRRPRDCPHNNLREVEITGFTGRINQIELARYLLHISTKLESMTIISRRREYEERFDKWILKKTYEQSLREFEERNGKQKLRKTWEQKVRCKAYTYLRKKTSSSAKLVII